MYKGEHSEVKMAHSKILPLATVVALYAAGSLARGQASAAQSPSQGQARSAFYTGGETDIGLNFYEAMNSTTTAMGVVQTPTNSPGGMLEIRQIRRPLVGYELTYSLNPANETIAPTPAPSCGYNCNTPAVKVPSKGNTVGLDWVFSAKFGMLRPFAAAGVGLFINEPPYSVPVGQAHAVTNNYSIRDVLRPAWLLGGGVDIDVSRHWGIRAQYRDMFYKVPNLSAMFPAQGVFTQTRMPMGGIFYAF